MALPTGASVTSDTLKHYPQIYYPGSGSTHKHPSKGGKGGKGK